MVVFERSALPGTKPIVSGVFMYFFFLFALSYIFCRYRWVVGCTFYYGRQEHMFWCDKFYRIYYLCVYFTVFCYGIHHRSPNIVGCLTAHSHPSNAWLIYYENWKIWLIKHFRSVRTTPWYLFVNFVWNFEHFVHWTTNFNVGWPECPNS